MAILKPIKIVENIKWIWSKLHLTANNNDDLQIYLLIKTVNLVENLIIDWCKAFIEIIKLKFVKYYFETYLGLKNKKYFLQSQ